LCASMACYAIQKCNISLIHRDIGRHMHPLHKLPYR
jgi:hypothetical protein